MDLLPLLKGRFVTLDFETYYDKDYCLSKMGPIEYIRDHRFAVLCCAIRVDLGETKVYEVDEIADVLRDLHLEREDTVTIGHNIAGFDGLILSEVYGVAPAYIFDTIAVARWCGLARCVASTHEAITAALGNGVKEHGTEWSIGRRTKDDFLPETWEKFKQYCHDDAEQCSENFYKMLDFVTEDALLFMSLTASMATRPVLQLDTTMLKGYIDKLNADADASMQKLVSLFQFATKAEFLKSIRSADKYCAMLRQLGVEPPMKKSAAKSQTAGHDVMSPALSKNDLAFTALLDHPDPRVRLLVSTRLERNSSIELTRAKRLYNLSLSGKPLPVMLQTFSSHTSRYAAGNSEGATDGLNMQNLAKRGSDLTLRKSIKVPKGMKIVACDSSQIEARMLAYIARQDDLVQQFREGRDPYSELAEKIFHVPAAEIKHGAKNGDKKLKSYRNVGKTCILSCLGADTLVLTDSGYKYIVNVSEEDLLWDGEKWTNHKGPIYRGEKTVLNWQGLHVTPDHLIWDSTSWNTADDVVRTPACWRSAVSSVVEPLLMHTLTTAAHMLNSFISSNAINVGQYNGSVQLVQQECLRLVATTVQQDYLPILNSLDLVIQTLNREISTGSLPSCNMNDVLHLVELTLTGWKECVLSNVPVGQQVGLSSRTLEVGKQQDVVLVLKEKPMTATSKSIPPMQTFVQTQQYVSDCLIGLLPLTRDVIIPSVKRISHTVVEGLSLRLGHAESASNTYLHLMDMIIRFYLLTALTTMVAMHVATYVSQTNQHKLPTSVLSLLCKQLSSVLKKNYELQKPSETNLSESSFPVYDILEVGDRHCFTVWTNCGPMLVHNCGYGVGSQKFSDTLLRQGVQLDDNVSTHQQLAQRAHAIYRQTNAMIVALWQRGQQIVCDLASGRSGKFGGPNDDLFEYGPYSVLGVDYPVPSIRMKGFDYYIRYPHLRRNTTTGEYEYDFQKGKSVMPRRLYGASLVENVTQGLAFQLLMWQACRVYDTFKLSPIANIHDCWVYAVPEGQAPYVSEVLQIIMSSCPVWMADFPVGCEAEIGDDYTVA